MYIFSFWNGLLKISLIYHHLLPYQSGLFLFPNVFPEAQLKFLGRMKRKKKKEKKTMLTVSCNSGKGRNTSEALRQEKQFKDLSDNVCRKLSTISFLILSMCCLCLLSWMLSEAWGHMAPQETSGMSGDIFRCHNWVMLQELNGSMSRELLNILQCPGQSPQKRIFRPQVSTALKLRNPHLLHPTPSVYSVMGNL